MPETSERANARLIRARLMVGKAAAARLIPLYAPADRPEDRLDELAGGVAAALPLSVVLLGMGEDMHVASIFPGAAGLQAALQGEAPVAALRAPGLPEARVTLTAPVLR
ncbi:MAG: 6-phosphogluconolactonase, partial [bacterium]